MKNQFERVCMVGLGYIGLPTAAVMASRGLKVIGLDVNPHVVETLNKGKIHIVEPGLDALVHGTVADGFLRATVTPESADAFLIAVPTPFMGDGHEPDLSYIESSARNIAPVLKAGNLVILESTSPVGATEKLSRWLAEARPDLTFPHQVGEAADVNVAHCPERVLPGRVLHELVDNDRVIGGMTPKCAERGAALYKNFVEGECIVTNARTAEMAKLTENAFRDVNIAFANELSLICDRLGIDVWELIGLANRHPRVNILKPGPGVGGHCIAVDPWFIVDSAPDLAKLIHTARDVNDGKPHYVIDQVRSAVKSVSGMPVIACLGLAFKPDIDDLRESPAMEIAADLALAKMGRLLVVEPHVTELPKALVGLPGVEWVTDAEIAIKQADVVLLLVDHRVFSQVDRACLEGKTVIDTRGMWR
ncbi:MAG: UDP-N-acetyl-D-mannosamine dehydrogenase [Gammaproteobacteria bacterium]|nr:UDP-N-acetyl-D-mannosamine dehydrogenase [Gammaproteobacteria bacterium]MCP5136006.1 UDP-N-acetyl-D-mannosamine dehydrogenase [Gammaproteobacteria bacterium]